MTLPPALRRALVRARRNTVFLLTGVPLHLAATPVWGSGAAITATTRAPGVLPVAAVIILLGTSALSAVQRRRHRSLLGMAIPGPPPTPRPRRLLRWLRSPHTWRQVGYHVVVGPLVAAVELLVVALACAAVGSATVYVWIWVTPGKESAFGYTTQAAYITLGGLSALCAVPWLAGATTLMESRLAAALLGPGRAEQLRRRVEDLAESRAGLVDVVDAERRRIERDLHDGTQQRLVSLAVNLGLARATLTDLPDEARKVIDEAHREAKEAITELNDLVRGLHPAVLEDRGLDAALSGLAARVPLSVRLRVDVSERAAPYVESVAYFVVSEALTNVTKHARATRVDVAVERVGNVLRVNVTDNGTGGADAAAGTGLSGLAKRVRSVDGTFRINSPAGGPTTVAVEVPCGP